MKWTRETPTEEGWYWVRNSANFPSVVKVRNHWGRLQIVYSGCVDLERLSVVPPANAEWAGPIPISTKEHWTREKPTEPGFYWYCLTNVKKKKGMTFNEVERAKWPHIVEVQIQIADYRTGLCFWYNGYGALCPDWMPVDKSPKSAEWVGPLSMPEDSE